MIVVPLTALHFLSGKCPSSTSGSDEDEEICSHLRFVLTWNISLPGRDSEETSSSYWSGQLKPAMNKVQWISKWNKKFLGGKTLAVTAGLQRNLGRNVSEASFQDSEWIKFLNIRTEIRKWSERLFTNLNQKVKLMWSYSSQRETTGVYSDSSGFQDMKA